MDQSPIGFSPSDICHVHESERHGYLYSFDNHFNAAPDVYRLPTTTDPCQSE